MQKLYDNATNLKIVGVVSPKPGTTSTALSPGVAYRAELIDYIIDYATNSDVVKKQVSNEEIDIFSGNKFDSKTNDFDFSFLDLVSIDNKKLQSAFEINIDEKDLENQTKNYMNEIANAVTTDTTPAKDAFGTSLNSFIDGLFASLGERVSFKEVDTVIDTYLNGDHAKGILKALEDNYVIPQDTFKTTYSGLLKGFLQVYISTYCAMDPSLTIDASNPVALVDENTKNIVLKSYMESAAILKTFDTMAVVMTESKMKKDILTKVGELTNQLTSAFASSLHVDQDKITSAFQLKFSEDELARVVSAMMTKTKTTAKSNLLRLGYQDKEEPTYISFYFTSFDNKEHFLKFIDSYNQSMEEWDQEDKVINYSDTTGILMSSVKTIVNAVSYVLIAFVSIALVVSSIMIGIITYISVYERTKEIGILRSIGASKRNISSIFNAETFIIGLLSGLFGIGISYLSIPVINALIHHYTGNIPLNASLRINNAIVLVILSVVLTLIGGLIPARKASKKDPVEALRSE